MFVNVYSNYNIFDKDNQLIKKLWDMCIVYLKLFMPVYDICTLQRHFKGSSDDEKKLLKNVILHFLNTNEIF